VSHPVACIYKGYLYMAHEFPKGIPANAVPLFAAEPEQRPWVGLTMDEQDGVYLNCGCNFMQSDDVQAFADAIESKLRERNT